MIKYYLFDKLDEVEIYSTVYEMQTFGNTCCNPLCIPLCLGCMITNQVCALQQAEGWLQGTRLVTVIVRVRACTKG